MKLCPVCNSQLPDNQEVPELVPLGYHEDALALSIKRRIAAEEKLRWIPVSERLPNKSGAYLYHDKGFTSFMYFDAEQKRFGRKYPNNEFVPVDITHWLPIPEPPEVK